MWNVDLLIFIWQLLDNKYVSPSSYVFSMFTHSTSQQEAKDSNFKTTTIPTTKLSEETFLQVNKALFQENVHKPI